MGQLPALPPGLAVPDTVDDLLELAGPIKIYVGLIGERDELLQKVPAPLSRMPRKGVDPFEFQVKFEGPFDPVVCVVLMENECRDTEWVFPCAYAANYGAGRRFTKGETYYITLRQLVE